MCVCVCVCVCARSLCRSQLCTHSSLSAHPIHTTIPHHNSTSHITTSTILIRSPPRTISSTISSTLTRVPPHHYPHTAHGTLLNTTHTCTRTYIAAANSKRKSMKLFAVAAAVLCATAAANEMVQQKGEVESVERRKNNGCRDRNISEIS